MKKLATMVAVLAVALTATVACGGKGGVSAECAAALDASGPTASEEVYEAVYYACSIEEWVTVAKAKGMEPHLEDWLRNFVAEYCDRQGLEEALACR